jgi:repressor LexA
VWEGKARHYNRKNVKSSITFCERPGLGLPPLHRLCPPSKKNRGNTRIPLAPGAILYKNTGYRAPAQGFSPFFSSFIRSFTHAQAHRTARTDPQPDQGSDRQHRFPADPRSANAAEEHLQALARKGAIEISPGTSRGIRLVGASVDTPPPVPAALLMALPLVGRVAAGSPILAQEHVEATYSVDPAMFSSKPDFLLKVKGWSMRDAGICDGDFLAVKKVDSAKNGQIVVARIGEEVTVKRYRKTGSTIELLPENPDFSVITVDPQTDEFALEGLAVGLLRSWH